MYKCAKIVIDSNLDIQVLYHYERRDYAEAKRASQKALKMNITGLIIGTIIWIVVIPLFVVGSLYEIGIIIL